MTATATVIVHTTLTLTSTLRRLASSSASRCNSSTAAQPLKLRALPPGSCVVQLLHKCQNHRTSRGAYRRLGNVGEKQRSMVSKEEEAKEARERGESWERLRLCSFQVERGLRCRGVKTHRPVRQQWRCGIRDVQSHRHVRQQWGRGIARVARRHFWTSLYSGIRRTGRLGSGGTTASIAHR